MADRRATDAPTPPVRWQATPMWWARRVLAGLVPVAGITWAAVILTGNAQRVLNGLTGVLGHHGARGVLVWIIAIAGIVVISLVGGIVSTLVTRRRERRFAGQHGFSYARSDPAFVDRWGCRPFNVGRGRRATDVLTGSVGGHACAMFTYRYTTGSGDDTSHTTLSVVSIHTGVALPRMGAAPESLLGMLAPGLTRLDIDIEDESFNRHYRVSAQSREYAVAMLNPRAVEALLAVEPFAWQVIGTDLVAAGPRASIDTLYARARALAGVADRVPGFIANTFGVGRPA